MTDLSRKRGDSFADEIAVTNDAGVAIDITGYTFVMTVDPAPAPISAANNVFSVAGAITSAVGGLVEFAPSTAQTDIVGVYHYDIQMIDASSRVRTIQSGRYTFEQDISK